MLNFSPLSNTTLTHMNDAIYSEDYVRKMLSRHICKVIFKKKSRKGDVIRTMICTSNWKWLNREDVAEAVGFIPPSSEKRKKWKDGLIGVFDMEQEDWRSFYIDKVKNFEIYQPILEH